MGLSDYLSDDNSRGLDPQPSSGLNSSQPSNGNTILPKGTSASMDLLLAIEENGSESKITNKMHEVLALKKASFVVPASTEDPSYATKKQDADFLEFHNIRTLHKADEARMKAWPLSSPEESKFKSAAVSLAHLNAVQYYSLLPFVFHQRCNNSICFVACIPRVP